MGGFLGFLIFYPPYGNEITSTILCHDRVHNKTLVVPGKVTEYVRSIFMLLKDLEKEVDTRKI